MDEGVLEAARAVRPYLGRLVGRKFEKVDAAIAELLNASTDDDEVCNRIRLLLNEYPGTAAFLEEVLADAPQYRPPYVHPRSLRQGNADEGGFEALPGEVGLIVAEKYRCPFGDFVWYRSAVGVSIPLCPTHDVALAAGRT